MIDEPCLLARDYLSEVVDHDCQDDMVCTKEMQVNDNDRDNACGYDDIYNTDSRNNSYSL